MQYEFGKVCWHRDIGRPMHNEKFVMIHENSDHTCEVARSDTGTVFTIPKDMLFPEPFKEPLKLEVHTIIDKFLLTYLANVDYALWDKIKTLPEKSNLKIIIEEIL